MKQRSDYTFKFNKGLGRHGWLRLTPAYSVKIVKEILGINPMFSIGSAKSTSILDPFSGTATTGIVAAEAGYNCTLYDINPFLVWLGTIKGENFDTREIDSLQYEILDFVSTFKPEGAKWIPNVAHIDRWWGEQTLAYLSNLRECLTSKWGEPTLQGTHNLLWIAFARLVIDSSAANFNHISMSFKEKAKEYSYKDLNRMFTTSLNYIFESARTPLYGQMKIYKSDSKYMEQSGSYDVVITSPPYPNRISYIRELRPYMYWLKFLSNGKEAGEIDWQAIGGTWGVATSKLKTWEPSNNDLPADLLNVCEKIEKADSKNGFTLSKYVLKFFDDMFIHLSNLRKHLNDGAKINYILGNSSFYGNYVKTDDYIINMLNRLGFSNPYSKIIRKRNSKSGLYEYLITADWGK